MVQANKLAGVTALLTQPVVNNRRVTRQARPDFAAAFQALQRNPTRTRATGAENLPPVTPIPSTPGPGSVIVSPFNPLGYPISATLAPTAAEVEANPDRWRGTSFDPALRVLPY